MVGIVTSVIHSAQPVGEIEERAEQGGAVIVHQFDQAGLLHQAAEFDEVTGALAPRLGPVAHVGAGFLGIQPMPLDCRLPQQARRRL